MARARRKALVKARCEGRLDDSQTENLIKVLRKNFSYEYLVFTLSFLDCLITTAEVLLIIIFCALNFYGIFFITCWRTISIYLQGQIPIMRNDVCAKVESKHQGFKFTSSDYLSITLKVNKYYYILYYLYTTNLFTKKADCSW